MSKYDLAKCSTCYSSGANLRSARADIGKLLRQAEFQGMDVAVPLAAAQVKYRYCQSVIAAHDAPGHGIEVPDGALPQGS